MGKKAHKLPEISVEAVEQQLGSLLIVDNNPVLGWAQAHVPGAINLDPADYTAADLPEDKNMTLVFYCSDPSCGAAPYAANRASRMGYTSVFVNAGRNRRLDRAGQTHGAR